MVKNVLILIILFTSQIAISQVTDSIGKDARKERVLLASSQDGETIYAEDEVEKKAYYPGGIKKFYAFADKTFKVPKGETFNGKIILSFVVEKDGSITNIEVVRNTGYGSPEEAVDMMSKSPKWIPAKLDGKSVRSKLELPLTFASKK